MKTEYSEKGIMMTDRGSKKNPMSYALSAPGFEKGFSLIEVMIAMVILLIGMLGVIGMQYYSVSGNSFSRNMRVAVTLAEQVHEQMKATPYVNLIPNADGPITDPVMTGGVAYTRRWWVEANCTSTVIGADNGTCAPLVSACDPAYLIPVPNAISAIKIRTCWNDKDGNNHSVTLEASRLNENL